MSVEDKTYLIFIPPESLTSIPAQTCQLTNSELIGKANMPQPLQYQWEAIRITDHVDLERWKRQLRGILLIEGAWCVICNELMRPKSCEVDDFAAWKKLADVALGWMFLTLEDYTRQGVVKYTNPMDVLRALFERYPVPFMTFDVFVEREKETSSEAWLAKRDANKALLEKYCQKWYGEYDSDDELRGLGRSSRGHRPSLIRGIFKVRLLHDLVKCALLTNVAEGYGW